MLAVEREATRNFNWRWGRASWAATRVAQRPFGGSRPEGANFQGPDSEEKGEVGTDTVPSHPGVLRFLEMEDFMQAWSSSCGQGIYPMLT